MGIKRFSLNHLVRVELDSTDNSSVTLITRDRSAEEDEFALDLVNFTGRLVVKAESIDTINESSDEFSYPNRLQLLPVVEVEHEIGQEPKIANHEPFSQALGKQVIEEMNEVLLGSPNCSSNMERSTASIDLPFENNMHQNSYDSEVFDSAHSIEVDEEKANIQRRTHQESGSTMEQQEDLLAVVAPNTTPPPQHRRKPSLFGMLGNLMGPKDEPSSPQLPEQSPHRKGGISIDENGNKIRGKALFIKAVEEIINQNQLRHTRSGSFDSAGSHPAIRKMSGNWGNLLYLAAVRNKFPSQIREKRQEVREIATLVAPIDEYPTKLHELCDHVEVSLSALQAELAQNPYAASVQDSNGRLPLHILGDNDKLVGTPIGRQTASTFAWSLMHAYPLGITTRDNLGHMPFVGMIEDWLQYTYSQWRKSRKRQTGGQRQSMTTGAANVASVAANATANAMSGTANVVSGTAASAWSKVKNVTAATNAMARRSVASPQQPPQEAASQTIKDPSTSQIDLGTASDHESKQGLNRNDKKPGKAPPTKASSGWAMLAKNTKQLSKKSEGSNGSRQNASLRWSEKIPSGQDVKEATEKRRKEINEYSLRAHPKVEMWEGVEWCFEMLSVAMDELGGKSGGLYKARKGALIHHTVKDRAARSALATHICVLMPSIVKTILLLEDDATDARKKLMKTSVFRRLLLCRESAGPWILNMLRKRSGIASTRCIDYLQLVSETTPHDFVGGYRTILPGDTEAFYDERGKVFEEVGNLDGIIASLVVLDRREIERASATAIVWSIMSKNLRRPFILGLVLIDFALHITLMLAFRRDVTLTREDDAIGNVPTQVVMFISSHYFIRKCCEGLSLFTVSPKVFRSYFLNIWTAFDFVSIIMVLAAITWNENNPNQFRQGLNSLIVGLLWIKVLGFLKVVNREMSTFILSLIQILRDLRYFMVVMAVIVFMFGDMMHIAISTKDDGQYCLANPDELSDPEMDFCSPTLVNSYLRVYSLLLGDFELSDYTNVDGLTALFVIFTLIGVIILLNVLIAVISDSYERAKIESVSLFGRARVTFVAQNNALESFLRPGSNVMEGLGNFESKTKQSVVLATRIFRYLVLAAIILTAMSAEVYLATRAFELIKAKELAIMTLIVVFVLTIVLTTSLWVVVNFAIDGLVRSHFPQWVVHIFDSTERCSRYLVNAMASRLFGLTEHDMNPHAMAEQEEEWAGRLMYMERVFENALEEAKDDLKDEIMALEKRLYEHNLMVSQEKEREHETREE